MASGIGDGSAKAPPRGESDTESFEPPSAYHSLPESGAAGGVGLGLSQSFGSQIDVEKNDKPIKECFEQEYKAELTGSSSLLTDHQENVLVDALYLSIASMFGAFLRVILAQLFGEECRNPGTVGWLAAGSPLCVTADGEAVQMNGIVFADFPANLLGSFIMGLLQSGDALQLPVNLSLAWLTPGNFFQNWHVIHLALRTGFCGSLTTFSSWNSDMVILMYSAGDTSGATNQVAKALFGYLIGMETALGSFVFGKMVARWIHRYVNPDLAREADAIVERKEEGVYINRKLPEFERRFLPDLDMKDGDCVVSCTAAVIETSSEPERVENLERWRVSTIEARRVGNELLPALIEIENSLLVDGQQSISPDLMEVARGAGWEIDSLQEWVRFRDQDKPVMVGSASAAGKVFPLRWALLLFVVVFSLLVLGLVAVNGEHAYSVTYRTMIYAAIFAPPGALLRWHLSTWNGKLGSDWSWFPVGTLVANVSGSTISIIVIALELRIVSDAFWGIGTLRAIKIGFAGCLTTVSTFVSEVQSLMQGSHQQYRAYFYMFVTLGLSSVIATILYGIIVFVF